VEEKRRSCVSDIGREVAKYVETIRVYSTIQMVEMLAFKLVVKVIMSSTLLRHFEISCRQSGSLSTKLEWYGAKNNLCQ
jgi:hypothetical protein